MDTLGKIDSCLDCSDDEKDLPHCGMLNAKMFRNGFLKYFPTDVQGKESVLLGGHRLMDV